MPKEYLSDPGPVLNETHGRWHSPEFSLHWVTGDDGFVQVAVEIDRQQLQKVVESEDINEVTEAKGTISLYSQPLSRRKLNEGIRALRRARDQVHGADE